MYYYPCIKTSRYRIYEVKNSLHLFSVRVLNINLFNTISNEDIKEELRVSKIDILLEQLSFTIQITLESEINMRTPAMVIFILMGLQLYLVFLDCM